MRGEAARGQAGTGTRGQGIPTRARARARKSNERPGGSGAWWTRETQKVGRGSPSPPLSEECLTSQQTYACRSANGRLGDPSLPKAAANIPVSGFPLSAEEQLRVSGLGSRESGTGCRVRVRVRVRVLNLDLVLNT
jgi:hypothetical protein